MKAVWYFKYPKEVAPGLFYIDIFNLFTLPANTNQILTRPWTIITYMFVHDNVWKVFANMLWLWCFGGILQDIAGNRKIIPLFIYGSLGGALVFVLAYNLIPSLAIPLLYTNAVGASAGLMAIAVATTLLSPGYRFFPMIGGGIPLWIISILYAASNVLTAYNDTSSLTLLIGGATTGFLFYYFLRIGFDWSNGMSNLFDWFGNLFNPDRPRKEKNIKEELFYKTTTTPYTKKANLTEQRIDIILDKINKHGYGSLSVEEKELLKKAGEDSV
jgi:membrane associated rhomboid family serine protease